MDYGDSLILDEWDALLKGRIDALESAFDSVLAQTLEGDRLVAKEFADGSQRFVEAVATVAPRGKPSHLQLVNRLVLLLRLNPPEADEHVKDTILQLEADGFYAFGWGEVHPESLLEWSLNQYRINAAFKDAREDHGGRKGLRDLLNMHIRRRNRAAKTAI